MELPYPNPQSPEMCLADEASARAPAPADVPPELAWSDPVSLPAAVTTAKCNGVDGICRAGGGGYLPPTTFLENIEKAHASGGGGEFAKTYVLGPTAIFHQESRQPAYLLRTAAPLPSPKETRPFGEEVVQRSNELADEAFASTFEVASRIFGKGDFAEGIAAAVGSVEQLLTFDTLTLRVAAERTVGPHIQPIWVRLFHDDVPPVMTRRMGLAA
jgi:hypothetical protein